MEYHRLRRATNEALTTYLLGQVLSFCLLSFGYEPLHATAVVIDGEAIAFLGDCGYGKSTLGAAFVIRGFPMLTDDVLTLELRDGRWLAHPGPARVKLYPAVAQRIFSHGRGRLLNPETSKLVVSLAGGHAIDRTVPLKAMYILPNPGRKGVGSGARVRISTVTGPTAFLEATRSSFNLIQVDRARLESQFTMTALLVRDVPLKRLSYPRQLSQLNTVCESVLDDCRGQRTRRA